MSRDSFSLKCHRHVTQQAALLPDRVSISFKSVVGLGAFPVWCGRLLLFKREEGGEGGEGWEGGIQIHNSGCWMK